MQNFKSHFRLNRQERSGIFFLLFLIIILQVGYFFSSKYRVANKEVIQVDAETQRRIDEIKQAEIAKDTFKINPFNPNYITDYKGYILGLSIDEIDRLHRFRDQNKFVNSADEFQEVTQISDSLLGSLSPYFKFPDWVNSKNNKLVKKTSKTAAKVTPTAVAILDLNKATAAELKSIRGIGDKLAARIVKFRDRLGGFLIDDQLYDVYGLPPEVVSSALKRFRVLEPPTIEKLDLNSATKEQLASLVYINYKVADAIVALRVSNGGIKSFDELLQIQDFPADRIHRIALYLYL